MRDPLLASLWEQSLDSLILRTYANEPEKGACWVENGACWGAVYVSYLLRNRAGPVEVWCAKLFLSVRRLHSLIFGSVSLTVLEKLARFIVTIVNLISRLSRTTQPHFENNHWTASLWEQSLDTGQPHFENNHCWIVPGRNACMHGMVDDCSVDDRQQSGLWHGSCHGPDWTRCLWELATGMKSTKFAQTLCRKKAVKSLLLGPQGTNNAGN